MLKRRGGGRKGKAVPRRGGSPSLALRDHLSHRKDRVQVGGLWQRDREEKEKGLRALTMNTPSKKDLKNQNHLRYPHFQHTLYCPL